MKLSLNNYCDVTTNPSIIHKIVRHNSCSYPISTKEQAFCVVNDIQYMQLIGLRCGNYSDLRTV